MVLSGLEVSLAALVRSTLGVRNRVTKMGKTNSSMLAQGQKAKASTRLEYSGRNSQKDLLPGREE